MIRYFFLIQLLFISIIVFPQAPPGYYDSAEGLSGLSLKIALHNIIKDHNAQPYNTVFQHFESTDMKPNGEVWDIYSDVPGGTPPYVYQFVVDQCGNYSQEGDCFNREHTWPTSWFGGSVMPMYSDLHMLFPTDGYVNMMRGNYPFGRVATPTWTSLNGGKLGPSSFPGYTGTVFEPIDEYKGDLARVFFYVTVRYYGQGDNWPGSEQTIGSELNAWSYDLIYNWHTNYPVSQKEIDRNNAVSFIQGNRNPFVDNPAWVDSILFPTSTNDKEFSPINVSAFPNPAYESINISSCMPITKINIYNSMGLLISENNAKKMRQKTIDISGLSEGFYFLKIKTHTGVKTKKIVVQQTGYQ